MKQPRFNKRTAGARFSWKSYEELLRLRQEQRRPGVRQPLEDDQLQGVRHRLLGGAFSRRRRALQRQWDWDVPSQGQLESRAFGRFQGRRFPLSHLARRRSWGVAGLEDGSLWHRVVGALRWRYGALANRRREQARRHLWSAPRVEESRGAPLRPSSLQLWWTRVSHRQDYVVDRVRRLRVRRGEVEVGSSSTPREWPVGEAEVAGWRALERSWRLAYPHRSKRRAHVARQRGWWSSPRRVVYQGVPDREELEVHTRFHQRYYSRRKEPGVDWFATLDPDKLRRLGSVRRVLKRYRHVDGAIWTHLKLRSPLRRARRGIGKEERALEYLFYLSNFHGPSQRVAKKVAWDWRTTGASFYGYHRPAIRQAWNRRRKGRGSTPPSWISSRESRDRSGGPRAWGSTLLRLRRRQVGKGKKVVLHRQWDAILDADDAPNCPAAVTAYRALPRSRRVRRAEEVGFPRLEGWADWGPPGGDALLPRDFPRRGVTEALEGVEDRDGQLEALQREPEPVESVEPVEAVVVEGEGEGESRVDPAASWVPAGPEAGERDRHWYSLVRAQLGLAPVAGPNDLVVLRPQNLREEVGRAEAVSVGRWWTGVTPLDAVRSTLDPQEKEVLRHLLASLRGEEVEAPEEPAQWKKEVVLQTLEEAKAQLGDHLQVTEEDLLRLRAGQAVNGVVHAEVAAVARELEELEARGDQEDLENPEDLLEEADGPEVAAIYRRVLRREEEELARWRLSSPSSWLPVPQEGPNRIQGREVDQEELELLLAQGLVEERDQPVASGAPVRVQGGPVIPQPVAGASVTPSPVTPSPVTPSPVTPSVGRPQPEADVPGEEEEDWWNEEGIPRVPTFTQWAGPVPAGETPEDRLQRWRSHLRLRQRPLELVPAVRDIEESEVALFLLPAEWASLPPGIHPSDDLDNEEPCKTFARRDYWALRGLPGVELFEGELEGAAKHLEAQKEIWMQVLAESRHPTDHVRRLSLRRTSGEETGPWFVFHRDRGLLVPRGVKSKLDPLVVYGR